MSVCDCTTRRSVLASIGSIAGGAVLPAGARPVETGRGRTAIDQLDYADVTLLDSPARAQFDTTLTALLAMDDGALLRPFRAAAGLPVAPRGLGGWYDASPAFDPPRDMHGFIPGHSFGQYVSALSRAYAVSGDARAQAKVRRLLAGFAPTLASDFYKDYPLPAYTFDKVLTGLIDAHSFAGDHQAMKLVRPATRQVLPYLPPRALDRQTIKVPPGRNTAFGWDETYTLPENLYLAADRGAGEDYRTMARRYLLDDTYFAPLAAGRNVLPGRHAYSHVNAFASALRAYIEDGSTMHLTAARNGMGFVLEQSFATGGWGPNEAFVQPGSGTLGKSLSTTHASFEAPCGTYGHFKVARSLMRITGDSRWGDSMERLFYNAALGVLPLRPDGVAFYYADYNHTGAKVYYESACPCCSGTIGQLTADYGISAYLRDDKGLFVNLYTPSRATWRRGGQPALALTQSGDYPFGNAVAMTVAASRPVTMALRLRIPAWAGPATRLTVNGSPEGAVTAGRFAVVTREWRDGDRIALTFDMPVRLESVDAQTPARVAAMQGPLALFAVGDRFTPLTRDQLLGLRRTSPARMEWMLPGDQGPQIFKPWSAIDSQASRLYQFLI